MTYIPAGSLCFAPYNPDDYPSFVSNAGVFLGLPTNDPLFDTDGYGTVTAGVIQLDNGRLCVNNLGNYQVGVFNADMTVRATNTGEDPQSIAGGYDTAYFYGVRNFATPRSVGKFNSNDASLVTNWSMSPLPNDTWALAVAKDESYAYVAPCVFATQSDITRINLSSLAQTTFITAAASTLTGENGMFCLRDGALMVAWSDGTIVHYSTAAAVLHTYTRSGAIAISSGLTDSSFWVHYLLTGVRRASEIQVSTGTVLHDFALPTGDPPAAHAGNASSTNWGQTFCVVRVAIGAPGTVPTTIAVNSTPCCDTTGTTGATGTNTATPNPGPVLQGFGWTPRCTGGGVVPSAADLTDSENWDV